MKIFKLVLCTGLTFFLLLSCSSEQKAKVYEYENVFNLDAPFDQVWTSVVEGFAINSVPISTIEKVSGIIVGKNINVPHTEGKRVIASRYADCGELDSQIFGNNRFRGLEGEYSVFLRPLVDESTEMRITTQYSAWVVNEDKVRIRKVPCNSTGAFEQDLLADIRSRL